MNKQPSMMDRTKRTDFSKLGISSKINRKVLDIGKMMENLCISTSIGDVAQHPSGMSGRPVTQVNAPHGTGPTVFTPGPLVLDFETFYDAKYSLSKMNIPEYVQDARFHVHGLAVCHPDGRTEFRTDVKALLRELQARYGAELEVAEVAMHNAIFDAFILKHRYGMTVRRPFCTRFASHLVNSPQQSASLHELAVRYGLDPKGHLEFMQGVRSPSPEQLRELAEYACRDVEITRSLYDRLAPILAQMPEEPAIIAHTVKMFVERPFAVDAATVDAALRELEAAVAGQLGTAGYTREHISGDSSFRKLMSAALAEVNEEMPMKMGKKGPIPALAKNDEAMIALRSHPHPKVRQLAELRAMVGSVPQSRSRLEYLLRAAKACNGSCHFELVYHKAQHGRFAGGGGFNIQNIPAPGKCRDPLQKMMAESIRAAIQAPPGLVLVAADASQIEARVLAWLAGQEDMLAAFAAKADIYSQFAGEVLGREVKKVPASDPRHDEMKLLRNVGKTAILGLGYGMGVERFMASLRSSPDTLKLFDDGVLNNEVCAKLVYGYRDKYPAVKDFWTHVGDAFQEAINGGEAEVNGIRFFCNGDKACIRLRSGRVITYPCARMETPDGEARSYIDRDGIPQAFSSEDDTLMFGKGVKLYGAKIVEHIVSGTARDILVHSILELEKAGWPVIGHIHDEIICATDPGRADECLRAMEQSWRDTPMWATGLVLDAEGKSGNSLADTK